MHRQNKIDSKQISNESSNLFKNAVIEIEFKCDNNILLYVMQ